MKFAFTSIAMAGLMMIAAAQTAFAQSSGASPADPNNERNQQMAPGNIQPTDPAAERNPGARVPTDPVERDAARREEGGATGNRTDAYPDNNNSGVSTGSLPRAN